MPHTVRFPRVPACRRDYMVRWRVARHTTGICTRVGRGHEAPTALPTLGRLARIVGAFTLIVSTTPRPRAEGVGTLAYVMHGECPLEGVVISGHPPRCPLGLALMHPDGSGQLQLTGDGADAEPAWSPDGLQLAFSRSGDVYVMPATGGTLLNLTNHPAFVYNAADNHDPDGSGSGTLVIKP
jgi:WD40-like Beta Propeller Repeat